MQRLNTFRHQQVLLLFILSPGLMFDRASDNDALIMSRTELIRVQFHLFPHLTVLILLIKTDFVVIMR